MPTKTLSTVRWLAVLALLALTGAQRGQAQSQSDSAIYPSALYPSAATATTRTPIVFIPGIMGSKLFNTLDGQENEVWVNLPRAITSNLSELGLAADGVSPSRDDPAYTTSHTKPGTTGLVTRVLIADFYGTLVNHFTQTHGYVEGVDFWVYPYDWRKDLRTSANSLDVLIQNILTQTGAPQVSIVAHSLGGLVTRQYLSNPARAARVR